MLKIGGKLIRWFKGHEDRNNDFKTSLLIFFEFF